MGEHGRAWGSIGEPEGVWGSVRDWGSVRKCGECEEVWGEREEVWRV